MITIIITTFVFGETKNKANFWLWAANLATDMAYMLLYVFFAYKRRVKGGYLTQIIFNTYIG